MSEPQPCPSPEQWQQHLDSGLPAERDAELSAHLSGCSACQKTVETLAAGGDSLLNVAGEVGKEPPDAEPSLRDLLANVPNPFDDTQAEVKERGDVDYSFLQPPTEPGHLGRLGHYAIVELVGRGGFGLVFRAFDEKLRRIVAIKVLAPELAANAIARRRFVREAQAVAAVSNEHVIAIYEVQETQQPPYLAMEFVEGQSLQTKIDRVGPLGTTEILRIGMQTAEGLAAAHQQGVIHRDIKPANILLENGVERVKITDFGLARVADDATMTRSGTIAGTPAYMSPEQAHGESIDARSDLFSLGSLLYAMAAGHAPFRASSAMAVLLRVVEQDPKPLRKINPDIPEWLADIIVKLHAKKPDARFQTAREVAACLGQWLAHMQQPSTTSRPVASQPIPPKRAPSGKSGRRIALLIGCLLVLPILLLGCVSSVLLYSLASHSEPAPVMPHEAMPPIVVDKEVAPKMMPDVLKKVEERKTEVGRAPRFEAKDVLACLAAVEGQLCETSVDLLLPLPGEARQAKGSTHISRIADRYLRLRTYNLPASLDMLQFIDCDDKTHDFQSWLFDSNGDDFAPIKGTWDVESQTLSLKTSGAALGRTMQQTIQIEANAATRRGPMDKSGKQESFFSYAFTRFDGTLRVTDVAPKITTGISWRVSNPLGGLFIPLPPLNVKPPAWPPEPLLPLNKQQDFLCQLAGKYLMDVVNKPTPGNSNAERAIVQAKWTKSLGGLVMEGHFHDAVSGESQCLLATFDAREKAYRLWLLPRKGEPMQATGVFDETAKVLTWKFTASDGARTELLWKFDGPDRCDWTMKKWDKGGTLLNDSEWTPRSRALPILPPPLKVPPDLDLPKIDDVKKVERNPDDLRRYRIFPHVSARADSTIRHRAVGIVAEEGLQQLEIELLSVAS